MSSTLRLPIKYFGCRYQIRTKRTGRGRLVTMQAFDENWNVLLGWEAAVAALKMVNNVFNFFLSGLSETLEETHLVFWFYYFCTINAKLNDKVCYLSNIIV